MYLGLLHNHRYVQIISLIFIILLLSLFGTSCKKVNPTSQLSVPSISDTYPRAESVAIDWQPDAQLHSASFWTSSNGEISVGSYAFLSESEHTLLSVFVQRSQSGYEIYPKEADWPEDRPIGTPISIQDVKLESQQALDTIIEQGGKEFLERYGIADLRFDLDLERLDRYQGTGPIVWQGSFSSSDPSAQLHIKIGDDDGELLDVTAYGQEQDYW